VVRRGQDPACSPPSQPATLRFKKNSPTILSSLRDFWRDCTPAFPQQRLADRAQALSLSSLLCLGRHTLTGLLTTSGREFQDWSADYRLFSRQRLPVSAIFDVIRRVVLAELPPTAPLSVAIDDSLLRKSGVRIPGVAWRRDPLGPSFQTNFVRAQRFLQLSAAVPLSAQAYRMIPIGWHHAPTPPKPSRKASAEQVKEYEQSARLARLPLIAVQKIRSLREALDREPNGAARPLHVCADGGYTNETVLKRLPARTVLIGRIRQDAKLHFPPPPSPRRPQPGRPRRYGALAPTPEQLRVDEASPWTTLDINVSGAPHQMRIKRLGPVLWRVAGLAHTLQLVVIAPLSYRLRKNSKLLYRRPAFLICTDPDLDLRTLVQEYVQRCDIETNFREEKTLLGVGQAQVRNPHSVETVPALQVASYAMLLLASIRAYRQPGTADLLPPPKWNTTSPPDRLSTPRAINQLRAELWHSALGFTNFSGFVAQHTTFTKPEKFTPDLPSAVLYAVN
jgi:hypothetical protein